MHQSQLCTFINVSNRDLLPREKYTESLNTISPKKILSRKVKKMTMTDTTGSPMTIKKGSSTQVFRRV